MSQEEPPQKLGDRLRVDGWRTGSVLCSELTKLVADRLQRARQVSRVLAPEDRLIVVSQTCDVVVPNLDPEPFIEVLVARERRAIDSTRANLRSTRYLSFHAQRAGAVLEAHATDRYWIPRELFSGYRPDVARSLGDSATRRVCEWLGLRYTRRPWPNSLVRRLPRLEQVEKVLRDVELTLAEIRVAISDVDKELPAGSPYRLTVYAVMDAGVYDSDPEAREACTKAFLEMLDLLRMCPGIVVSTDSDLIPGQEFSWQLLQMTDPWNLANLTAQAEDS